MCFVKFHEMSLPYVRKGVRERLPLFPAFPPGPLETPATQAKKSWKPSNKQTRKQKLKIKWSGGINFMNKPWVCFLVFFFVVVVVVVLFQTLKFSVYTELNKLSSITFSETNLYAVRM